MQDLTLETRPGTQTLDPRPLKTLLHLLPYAYAVCQACISLFQFLSNGAPEVTRVAIWGTCGPLERSPGPCSRCKLLCSTAQLTCISPVSLLGTPTPRQGAS